MTDSTNTFKDVQISTDSNSVSFLYDDVVSTNFDSFKSEATQPQNSEFLSMTPIFGVNENSDVAGAKKEGNCIMDIDDKVIKLPEIKVLERPTKQYLADIANADRALENAPANDRVISKYETFVKNVQKDIYSRTSDIVQQAGRNLTAKEWKEFSNLGGMGIGKGPKGEPVVDLSNAQRAWLKEKHPEIYKNVEQLDGANLQKLRAETSLRAAEDIRDKPIAARLDYIDHLERTHKVPQQETIQALTEIAGMPRSPQMEQRFRDLARGTAAAWNKDFRAAIEKGGGNILDYVQRPIRFDGIKPVHEWIPGEKKKH